ncbi:hypothetical protein PR048_017483 [Dryococelus australis]|uniref:Uncharacterized protein n=1 Tax=Dryococelus australis TaxID=614101 RepID=A0ABQ9H9M6_9NEOP|nr:hypothetical protein PR048_017483 [Dryococelus australis]
MRPVLTPTGSGPDNPTAQKIPRAQAVAPALSRTWLRLPKRKREAERLTKNQSQVAVRRAGESASTRPPNPPPPPHQLVPSSSNCSLSQGEVARHWWSSQVLAVRLLAPTKANRVQSPAGSLLDFRKWKSRRKMPLAGGFSRVFSVSPDLAFRRCSILTSFNLVGSQDLVVKSLLKSLNLTFSMVDVVQSSVVSPLDCSPLLFCTTTPPSGGSSLGSSSSSIPTNPNARFWERASCLIGYYELRKVRYWLGCRWAISRNKVTRLQDLPNLQITLCYWGRGDGAISTLASTTANRVQSPAASLLDFRKWESGFVGKLSFPRPLHYGAAPYSLQSPSSVLKTSLLRAAQISPLTHSLTLHYCEKWTRVKKTCHSTVQMAWSLWCDGRLSQLVAFPGTYGGLESRGCRARQSVADTVQSPATAPMIFNPRFRFAPARPRCDTRVRNLLKEDAAVQHIDVLSAAGKDETRCQPCAVLHRQLLYFNLKLLGGRKTQKHGRQGKERRKRRELCVSQEAELVSFVVLAAVGNFSVCFIRHRLAGIGTFRRFTDSQARVATRALASDQDEPYSNPSGVTPHFLTWKSCR